MTFPTAMSLTSPLLNPLLLPKGIAGRMDADHSAARPKIGDGWIGFGADQARVLSPEDQFTFVHVGTLGEPLNMEVRKDGLAIGRILHVEEIFHFHKGMTSIAYSASAHYTTSTSSRSGSGSRSSPASLG